MQRYRVEHGHLLVDIQQLDRDLQPPKWPALAEKPSDFSVQNGILTVGADRFAASLSRLDRLREAGKITSAVITYPNAPFILTLDFNQHGAPAGTPAFGRAFLMKQGPASALAVSEIALLSGTVTSPALGLLRVTQAPGEAWDDETTAQDWLKQYLAVTRTGSRPEIRTQRFNSDALAEAAGELSDPSATIRLRFAVATEFPDGRKGVSFLVARPDAPLETTGDFTWPDLPLPSDKQDFLREERLALAWSLAQRLERDGAVSLISTRGELLARAIPLPR